MVKASESDDVADANPPTKSVMCQTDDVIIKDSILKQQKIYCHGYFITKTVIMFKNYNVYVLTKNC